MSEDKRQNEIIRIQKKRSSFVTMDKGFLENNNLSYKAKGILAYLLSKPDNWKVIVGDLINHSKDGKAAVYSGLQELKKQGYYRKIPIRNVTGQRISHWESVIFECPEDEPVDHEEKPEICLLPENRDVDKSTEKSTSSLFPDFQYIDNQYLENQFIENQEHNNNYNSNNYPKNNKSSQSQVRTDTTLTLDKNNSDDKTGKKLHSLTYNEEDYYLLRKIIQSNIGYENLTYQIQDRELINNIVQVMLDVILTDKPPTLKIGNEIKSRDIVKSIYLKLSEDHIIYVIDQFKAQNHKITHKTSYLRTMLYSSFLEMDAHYTNQVRADGIVF